MYARTTWHAAHLYVCVCMRYKHTHKHACIEYIDEYMHACTHAWIHLHAYISARQGHWSSDWRHILPHDHTWKHASKKETILHILDMSFKVNAQLACMRDQSWSSDSSSAKPFLLLCYQLCALISYVMPSSFHTCSCQIVFLTFGMYLPGRICLCNLSTSCNMQALKRVMGELWAGLGLISIQAATDHQC
jgi:hypothetical protein